MKNTWKTNKIKFTDGTTIEDFTFETKGNESALIVARKIVQEKFGRDLLRAMSYSFVLVIK